MINYSISEETLGYESNEDPANTDRRLLMAGSKNVLVDGQRRVLTRGGYYRDDADPGSAAIEPVRNAWTWRTSTGTEVPLRFHGTVLEARLGTVDGVDLSEWVAVYSAFSASKQLRHAEWFDPTEKIDVAVMVNGDANMYEWNGAVAVVDSVGASTITKKGALTFAEARFYTGRNKTVVCARTGTEYAYTGGEDSTTLTGISDTSGLQDGDVLIQKPVVQSDKPISSHSNDVVFGFENQIVVGSESDDLVYASKNSSYVDFTSSTPRAAGEGFLLTLDSPTVGISTVGKNLVIFSGRSLIYRVDYEQITVGTNLAETVKVRRIDAGTDQGAMSNETIVPIGDSVAYISNEPALRIVGNPDELAGIDPKTFSYPIKPDFEAENWEGAHGAWVSNVLILSAPASGRLWMLNFVEDADGNLKRYWNPPQTLPVGPMSVFDAGAGERLFGHSSLVPETYMLFEGRSDGQYKGMDPADKRAIPCVALYPYDRGVAGSSRPGDRARLKTLDEWFVEGEATSNAVVSADLEYDLDGSTQMVGKEIDGSDEGILEGSVIGNSLAQTSLADEPLGGMLSAPPDSRRFHVVFDIPREDYFGVADMYSSQIVDAYWAIVARGGNSTLSPRRPINIHR